MAKFLDLKGTSEQSIQIQKGGPRLTNAAGVIQVRTASGLANAELKAKTIKVSDNSIEWNTDAAGAGANWKMTLQRPVAGMTAALDFVLPSGYGTSGQLLTTDGAGNMSWVSPGGTAAQNSAKFNLVVGSPATNAFFTLPAANIIFDVIVIIDTPWDDAGAQVSVGIVGSTSKYMGVNQNDLAGSAKDRYETGPGEAAPVANEAVIITYAAAAAITGAARIIAVYGGF